jgi:DNA-directed RNA polymerase subunit M/transcription elongation factor TFIIS
MKVKQITENTKVDVICGSCGCSSIIQLKNVSADENGEYWYTCLHCKKEQNFKEDSA